MENQLKPAKFDQAYVNALLACAGKGDVSTLPEIRKFLDTYPEFCRQMGDMAGHLRTTILNHVSEGNLFAEEAFSRQLDELEAEIAGPSPTLMERLLARRIALGWAMTHIAETDGFTKSTKGENENACIQRRMDSANRRLMQSMKALATVRRLLPPEKKPKVFEGQ